MYCDHTTEQHDKWMKEMDTKKVQKPEVKVVEAPTSATDQNPSDTTPCNSKLALMHSELC